MNNHTPGPMEVSMITLHGYVRQKATNPMPLCCASPEDAPVIAASYTMVDKAARELGVEAVELAKLDLAALIRFHLGVSNCLDRLADSPLSFVDNVRAGAAGIDNPVPRNRA